eukprot:6198119-Pleurochrysis_carterae.AAC.2
MSERRTMLEAPQRPISSVCSSCGLSGGLPLCDTSSRSRQYLGSISAVSKQLLGSTPPTSRRFQIQSNANPTAPTTLGRRSRIAPAQ